MSRPRCPRCLRPSSHCLCALIPQLESLTEVLFIQHPDEQPHPLNTARLAYLGLTNAQLLVAERLPQELLAGLDDGRTWLLFPSEEAKPVEHLAHGQSAQRLIVPDGTWRKARKLLYVNPELAELPRLALPAGLSSRYRLRKAPAEGALSTIEAVVYALEAIEGQGRFQALLKPFDALIEGQIEAMGRQTYQRNYQPQRPDA